MSRDAIVLLGVNHKTTPLAVREKLALSSGYEAPLQALAELQELREFYLLSTCNRVEVLFTCRNVAQATKRVQEVLFGQAITAEELQQHVYHYVNLQAVEHLFLVAASLDSMIVGEAQILGQLKEAYRHATDADSTGFILNKLLHKSFSVAKRVRTETRIGASAVSISYAAVELARKIFGDLHDKKVMLVGAGEMAELAAEHLVGQGVSEVVVANRTLQRAVNLARCYKGRAVSLEELLEQLQQVDIIISSTGAPELILRREDVRPVMRGRRNRPLFFIDIAVPRDLDPAINELDNVYLYDIDDLNNVVEMNKSERDKEAVKAQRIVDEEKIKFSKWLANMESTPTIIQLRKTIEQQVRGEVEKSLGRLDDMDASSRKKLEKMIAGITGKLAYPPLHFLKTENHCIALPERIKTIRELYQMDNGENEQE
ncbi:glutamyl-tRNA reductase [Desulfobulbus rhabdoformis]|jgi:glutamyl-tRNA reductase|uniref:glutamyl-tRNA reductase n=1 Tax=Desulfobulbus rhabdoformis TaxID=34032 RepID=UPI0019644DBF|nr:glutamyl-tRNA reductase [Desulfobulbus rhabdoformis]MBM9613369.1 glutamyl-tRNA reductase [Desulfobulbus rhabdoformis]